MKQVENGSWGSERFREMTLRGTGGTEFFWVGTGKIWGGTAFFSSSIFLVRVIWYSIFLRQKSLHKNFFFRWDCEIPPKFPRSVRLGKGRSIRNRLTWSF